MSDNNDQISDQKNASNDQPCCDGGSCCPSDSGSSGKVWKMVIFIIIMIAAGAVLAHSLVNKSNSYSTQSQQAFATIQIDDGADAPTMPKVIEEVEEPVESEAKIETPLVVVESKKQDMPVKAAVPSLWKADLDSLASLNKVAADSDAVFVLITAKDQLNDKTIITEIEAAAQKIIANGTKVSAFRLKESAPEYANLAKQVSVPSVLAMVKGLGMSAVSGEINETKLVQAFVAASRPSGCGPSGCGPTGCELAPTKQGTEK
jgi:hypothetical protein